MSIVETMSEPERQSWVTLIADGLVFIWFWKTIAPGWSLMPRALSPSEAGGLFLILVIITIFYHAVIGAAFALRANKDGVEKDERDLEIQSFGARIGYSALQIGLGVIIVIALVTYVAGTDYAPPNVVSSPINLTTPVQFLFALVFLSYVADLMRHGVIVARYRMTA